MWGETSRPNCESADLRGHHESGAMRIERVLEWLDRAGPDLTLVGGQAVA